MRQRVSLITLGVADLNRSRGFYEALGWATGAAPDDDVVFFQAGDMVLALWDRAGLAEDSCVEDGGGWGGVTLALNLGSPEEVDAAIEDARAAGAGSEPRSGAATRSLQIPTAPVGGRPQPALDPGGSGCPEQAADTAMVRSLAARDLSTLARSALRARGGRAGICR